MTGRSSLIAAAVALAIGGGAGTASAQTEIQWWHAMGGALGERVVEIADNFNRSQSEYKLVPVNKGNYTETVTAGIAAFRAGKPPHILQVFEVGTATMMGAKGAIKPVHELMAETGAPFDPDDYLGAVTGYYTTTDGKMLSMPFNSSTPVLFYNKEAFQKAGLDPNKPPKTWPEVGDYARKLVAAGYACGFSTAWQSWVHLENFSAWHNVPFGTRENGFAGLDTEFKFNSPLHVKHIQQMADWQKDKIFVYGGRRNLGNAKFTSGDCAMYTESSAGYGGFKKNAKFEFGTANLPYWPDVAGAPQNTIIGGASLWVMGGHSKEDYEGVAKFFSFLSLPLVQAYWHQNTGYVPITAAAFELTKKLGYYDANPGRDIPIHQMGDKAPTANSKGLRFGSFVQVREIIYEELEAIWAGQKTAQKGLDDAVQRGNALLRKFEKANR
ncbi:MAG: sn-glycerol-3-phosphate ABC transporter substrate-binding protein UgpB [Rhodospirillales bacterium]|nr:sn-glycerol-3-phosphate ABC transporter substrate-binding protein UgpB [Rhodospirillales bacterium]MDH3914415.1 sn-glycerol-3-phosphate ABC transporter substrate-binding protein UgpB [Rhodospirillales bacterium]MDH3965381.1 sn-glycerol-3-phosphate ABC transporter substrate-binding protein UgpB [Rhodospirillales bacterium]